MKRVIPPVLLTLIVTLGVQDRAAAHCEVPCGIYGDQARFTAMLEDATTIHKAMSTLNDLVAKTDNRSRNQFTRWVVTKESHATRIQQTIAQYFMTQRIKPGGQKYVETLTTAHAVMIAAMKCKQDVDLKKAAALKQAIIDFYEAYEGKKFGGEDGHGHTHK